MAKEATLADIQKSYDDAIAKAANPEAKAELKVERATAVAEWRLKDVALREKQLWTREALTEFPLAREFADQVAGDTEEAIKGSAKALHERIHNLFESHRRDLEIKQLIEQHMNGSKPEVDDESGETV